MQADRGHWLVNVVIGFSLLIGGMFAADAVARALYPHQDQLSVFSYLCPLFLLPFGMFYYWAKPTGNPLWMDGLYILVALSGLVAIVAVLRHFGMDRKMLPVLVSVLWGTFCHNAYFRWIRAKRPAARDI